MKIPFKAFLLILLGTVVWSLTMVKSGLVYSYGMGFWGPNGHDGIWHIALIESLARGSVDMPTFTGEALQNYHIGFDLILTLIHKLTTIPTVTLYFQIAPPLLALLIGYLSYQFVLTWRKKEKEAFWATFFVYFAGSFGWVLSLVRDGDLGGESTFWAQQAISTLVNPPFALSLVVVLLGLISLLRKKGFLAVVLFGVLIQIKAHAGILALGGLLLSGIYEYSKEKKRDYLKVFLGSLVISILVSLPFLTSSNLLVFRPFWFLETMMGFGDRLGWQRFYSAMTNYVLAGNWLKAVPAYMVAFIVFLLGNLGTRMVSFSLFYSWLRKKRFSESFLFIVSVILLGISLPMFFLQRGTAWNTIQFFYYPLFFLSILSGIALSKVRKELVLIIVLLTVPTTVGTLRHYLPGRPPAMIPKEELEALRVLEREPWGVVVTFPFDEVKAGAAEASPPRPLYLYESTAYVSAFSKKPTFLEDEVNLEITGYSWRERRENLTNFLENPNPSDSKAFLKENSISYLYFLKEQKPFLSGEELGLSKIFENSSVLVLKVDK